MPRRLCVGRTLFLIDARIRRRIDAQDTTMALPKKKTSKSKTRSRRAAAWKLDAPSRSTCPRCSATKVPHTVCPECGWYKGRQAVEVE